MTKRRMVQLVTFLALNAGALVQLKWFCPQIMYCHACPASVVACPIGVIGSFLAAGLVPLFALGLLTVIGAAVGRLLCGWACPFGLLQDLLAALPVRPRELPRWTRGVKYAILATMVVAVPLTLGTGSALYYCRTCPVATTVAVLPSAVTGTPLPLDDVSVVRYGLLAGVVVLCVLVPRGFCRVLCPVAALVAPLNEASALAVRVS
jgi:ferredoxin-type protein NapH